MKSKRRRSAKVQITVPFHDVDSMNVVWHGHYYKYFEIARTAFVRAVGFDLAEMKRSGFIWPVIETHCRYIAPILYGQTVTVSATPADLEHRVKFTYIVTDHKTGKRMATGYTVQAAVHAKTGALSLMTPAIFLRHVRGGKQ